MSSEADIIRLVDGILPPCPQRLSKLMESDAELIQFDDKTKLLFTTDEFSEEDHFNSHNPRLLGWNVAVGSVSDILAAGGVPKFYGHAMVIGRDWNEKTVKDFTRGVADALLACGAGFMGGDFGISHQWRYTATVIGELPGGQLTRAGAKENHGIYLSGRMGAGNLAAASRIFSGHGELEPLTRFALPKFPLRLGEAALVRRFASSCIDTSDGVFNALNTLADVNGTGYAIDNLPYLNKGKTAARLLSLPPLLLFMGECGEYELLFTVPRDTESKFAAAARLQGRRFYRLGAVTSGGRVLIREGRPFPLENINFRARDYNEPETYIKTMAEALNRAGLHG